MGPGTTQSAAPNATKAGFTLLELVVVVAIAMVLAAIAIPAITNSLRVFTYKSSIAAFTGAIQSTRYQAIYHGCPYQLAFSSSTMTYTVASQVPTVVGSASCLTAMGTPSAADPAARKRRQAKPGSDAAISSERPGRSHGRDIDSGVDVLGPAERDDHDFGVREDLCHAVSAAANSGFTILEVMVAILVLTIGLVGTAALMSTTVSSTARSHLMSTAALLASEKLEDLSRFDVNDSPVAPGGSLVAEHDQLFR